MPGTQVVTAPLPIGWTLARWLLLGMSVLSLGESMTSVPGPHLRTGSESLPFEEVTRLLLKMLLPWGSCWLDVLGPRALNCISQIWNAKLWSCRRIYVERLRSPCCEEEESAVAGVPPATKLKKVLSGPLRGGTPRLKGRPCVFCPLRSQYKFLNC